MTTERREIIVEGQRRRRRTGWPYEFKYKPGDLNRRPGFVEPFQPRLDWQMWFAALGDYRDNPWFGIFVNDCCKARPRFWRCWRKIHFPSNRRVLFAPNFTIITSPTSPNAAQPARGGSVNLSANTCRRFRFMNKCRATFMSEPNQHRAAYWFTPVALWHFARAVRVRDISASRSRACESFVVRDFGFFAYPLAHFQQGMFLARRTSVLESLQQLRRAVPRAMEHHAALSAGADLSDAAAGVVAEFFLPGCICGLAGWACIFSRAAGRETISPPRSPEQFSHSTASR